jgi:hypothetical protein
MTLSQRGQLIARKRETALIPTKENERRMERTECLKLNTLPIEPQAES